MTPQKKVQEGKVQDETSSCCDNNSTLHFRQHQTQLAHPGCWLSHAACRPEQQSWSRRTCVSVLPFLPFGLMQGRFHLHPVMYKMKVRRKKKTKSGCR